MTPLRAGFLVVFLACTAYANSLGNGFAYDDNAILPQNPVTTSGDWRTALSSPYQPDALEGAGLYRPVTSASFALEWRAFGDVTLGYHLLNLVFHALVSLLIFLLIWEFGGILPGVVGGALFAVHPLHTEAVANVVGRGELYSAFFFLIACLLYWTGRNWTGLRRVSRLLGLGCVYFLSLGAKEIGVTLPAALLLLEVLRPTLERRREGTKGRAPGGEAGEPGHLSLRSRLLRETGTYLLLMVVLLAYLAMRFTVLGTLTGEAPAPIFRDMGSGQRILTAVSLWVQYARLLVFPLDLAVDYTPGVLFPAEGLDLGVLLGAVIMFGLPYLAFRMLRATPSHPLVALGIFWFVLVILPVSNLFFPTGTLLAERTLYLPSVGLSFVAAGVSLLVLDARLHIRRWVLALSLVVLFGLFLRTAVRNPSWADTFVMWQTLNQDHPESQMAFLLRGRGLDRIGDTRAAREQYAFAVRLGPQRRAILTEVAAFYGRMEEWEEAERLVLRAIEIAPYRDDGYRLLSTQLLRQGRGREAHQVALTGLARSGPNSELWGAVSESYLLRGDLDAALRARQAAVGLESDSAEQWDRLGDVLEALGDPEAAGEAWGRAARIRGGSPRGTGALPPTEAEPEGDARGEIPE